MRAGTAALWSWGKGTFTVLIQSPNLTIIHYTRPAAILQEEILIYRR